MNDLQFTGDDFFADKDVCSIVLEVPNSALAPERLGLWARTLVGAGGKWVQVDRGALPAQAVFLVGAERDAYLAGEPVDDARFVAGFAHALEHAGGYAPDEARRVAGTLLPEMLSYDPPCILSGQWADTHRRRGRCFFGDPQKREGDQGRSEGD